MHLLPPLLSQHFDLPERTPLGVDRRACRRHPAPPLSKWGGDFSVTTPGDYWVTRDTEGKSVRDMADARGHTEAAIYWHLQRIYQKHSISRQADLVRLVLSLAELG